MPYPYKTQPFKKRRRRKKVKAKPFTRREFNKLNKKVSRIQSKTDRMVKATETKIHDIGPITDAGITYNGILDSLNDIPQGSTDTGRIGDSCWCYKLKYRVVWTAHGSAVTQGRFMIVVDKTGDLISQLSDVWNQAGTAYAPIGMIDHDLRHDINVLYDSKMIPLVPSTDSGVQVFEGTLSIPKKYSDTQFEAGTAGVNQNEIKILFMTDVAPAGNFPTVDYFTRVFFNDN